MSYNHSTFFDGSDEGSGGWGIGVSLSGGGHRSTLVSLGVLLAIVDVELNQFVRSISSVSGGSLANAFVWSRCNYRKVSPEEFSAHVRSAIEYVRRGAIFGTRSSKYRIFLLGASFAILGAVTFIWVQIIAARSGLALGGGLLTALLASWLVHFRGSILERNIKDLWFAQDDCRFEFEGLAPQDGITEELDNALRDQDQPTLHLIASTDLITGDPVYFTQGSVIADRMAWPLTSIPLVRAVRASMTVPVVLPPVKLSLADLVHRGSEIGRTRDRKLALVDGGVFNNLGTDWDLTLRDTVRAADYMVLHPSHSIRVAIRCIVDASTESDIGPSRIASVPVIGSIHNALRAIRITFRSGLYGRQLSEIYLADRSTLAIRAGNVDARLEWNLPDDMHLTRTIWAHVAERTRLTPTTLRALANDDCVLLVAHGYREATAVLYSGGARQVTGNAWNSWLGHAVDQIVRNRRDLAKPDFFPTKPL
jgi:Patatin-like phospholipase